MRTLFTYLLVIGFSLVYPHTSLRAAEPLLLVTTDSEPLNDSANTGLYQRIMTEAFRRIGYGVDFEALPAERALQMADQGLVDGDLGRIAGLDRQYANLRLVPEPIYQMEFTAFSNKPALKTASWDDLRNYDVGIIRGWKILEEKTNGYPSVRSVTDANSLFAMLRLKRIDVGLYAKWQGVYMLARAPDPDVAIVEPALMSLDMYLYLNKKHEHLTAKLADALREMKRDGTYDAIFKDTFQPLLIEAGME